MNEKLTKLTSPSLVVSLQLGPKDKNGNLLPARYLFIYDDAWVPRTDEATGLLALEPSLVSDRTRYLAFLTEAYRPRTFWFIILENNRRLLLSSVLVIFAVKSEDTGTAPQAVSALLLCIVGIKVYHYYTPFVNPTDNAYSELVQWVLASMFLAALMIRVQATNEGSEAQAKMSALLILVALSAFVVLFWFIVKEFRNELKKDEKALRQSLGVAASIMEKKPPKIKPGKGTSLDDKKTTLKSKPGKGTPMDGKKVKEKKDDPLGSTL